MNKNPEHMQPETTLLRRLANDVDELGDQLARSKRSFSLPGFVGIIAVDALARGLTKTDEHVQRAKQAVLDLRKPSS